MSRWDPPTLYVKLRVQLQDRLDKFSGSIAFISLPFFFVHAYLKIFQVGKKSSSLYSSGYTAAAKYINASEDNIGNLTYLLLYKAMI